MLAPERQHQILTLLEQRGIVRTIDLAEEFQVTDETIRRDLQALAESGEAQLKRIHGGAKSLNGKSKLRSFSERSHLNIEAKQAIAATALKLIQPDRTYAFDSSTTACAVAAILPDLPYRVVTNAFAILELLLEKDSVDLISTGGRYHPKTHTFIGGDSISNLRRHQIHTAFVSCIGFDVERGASEGFEHQAIFKESLVHYAKEVVLLVDSSKINQQSEYFFAPLERISRVITDPGIAPAAAEAIRACGLKLSIANKETIE
jgi:DeoR/GlpR family transcriptional regulator of sugar metabolism